MVKAVTVAAVVVAVGVVAAGAWAWWVANPPRPELPDQVDVVLAFAGHSARAQTAVELVADEKKAPALVLSNGDDLVPAPADQCRQRRPYEVICPVPDPANTRGEARMFADLARQHGWRSAIAVTSTQHVRRAQALLERCWPEGDITFLPVDPQRGNSWSDLPHELGGLLQATFIRNC